MLFALILGFSTLPEDWQRRRREGLFTDFYFILFAVMMSSTSLLAFWELCLYLCACVCVYVYIVSWLCLRTVCVRTDVYTYLMWDEDSYCSDWGILLPSIEPQETELIEIFIGRPDTNVQIRCSCIIKQTLRNSKIQLGQSENRTKSLTQCIHFRNVTVRKILFTKWNKCKAIYLNEALSVFRSVPILITGVNLTQVCLQSLTLCQALMSKIK